MMVYSLSRQAITTLLAVHSALDRFDANICIPSLIIRASQKMSTH